MERPSFRDSKTAFVIISWNSAAYIEKCVESVLALQCRKLDVWVVDNGSTDDTPEILERIAGRDGRLYVIREGRATRRSGASPPTPTTSACSTPTRW